MFFTGAYWKQKTEQILNKFMKQFLMGKTSYFFIKFVVVITFINIL